MLKVKEILDSIAATSSRNEKEVILKKYKDNELLREVLKFVYDNFVVTGISDKKIKKKVAIRGFNKIDNLMEYLKENNTGTDLDIVSVQTYIKQQPEELQELYTQIATKNLKIGMTAKSLNKVYGKGFIPEFNVLLAESYFKNEDKVKGEFIITTKYDGNRMVLVKENDKVKCYSRQGQLIEGLIEIEEDAKLLPDSMVFDGEVLLRNDKGLDSKTLFQETQKVIRRKDTVKNNLIFHVFDMMPVNEFKIGISKLDCKTRKTQLHELLDELKLDHMAEVPMLYIGTDKEQINKYLQQALDSQQEGIMISIAKSPYENKRTKNLLKVKVMQSADCKITGFEQGSGKFANTLGAVVIDYKGHPVKIGSGYSDEDREYIWKNKDSLLGRIVEMQFFEQTENQHGGISVRFPVFKCIREIGKEVSYN